MEPPSSKKGPDIVDTQGAIKRLVSPHSSTTSPLSFQSLLGCLDVSRSGAKPNDSRTKDKQKQSFLPRLASYFFTVSRFLDRSQRTCICACTSAGTKPQDRILTFIFPASSVLWTKGALTSLYPANKTCSGLEIFDSLSSSFIAVELDIDSFTSKTCVPA